MDTKKRKCILVLGMHRSGTSMITHILEQFGCFIGRDDEILAPAPDNPKGFYERLDVKELNDWVLRELGYKWNRLANFSLAEVNLELKDEFFRRINKIFQSIDDGKPIVFKDPRICLILELWQEAIEIDHLIIVIRNPVHIAASLRRRNGMEIIHSLFLWEKYMQLMLSQIRTIPFTILNYSEFIKSPFSSINSLLQRINIVEDASVKYFHDSGIIDQKLDHSGLPQNQHLSKDILSVFQSNLYKALQHRKLDQAIDLVRNSKHEIDEILKYFESIYFKESQYDKNSGELLKFKELEGDLIEKIKSRDSFIVKITKKFQMESLSNVEEVNRLNHDFKAMESKAEELERKIEDLRVQNDEFRKINESLVVRNSALLEDRRQISKIVHEIENDYYDLLYSWRWKFGHFLASFIEKVLFRDKPYLSLYKISDKLRYLNNKLLIQAGNREVLKYKSPIFEFAESTKPILELKRLYRKGSITDLSLSTTQRYDFDSVWKVFNQNRPIDIIIPVYNNLELLKNCLSSIKKYTRYPHKIFIIDDSSTLESGVPEFLHSLGRDQSIITITNDRNLGFVKTANRGVSLSTNDIILLNSDTEVSPRWIQKLIFAAYSDSRVATVTPVSNASGAFSVPEIGDNREVPVYLTKDEFARIVENSGPLKGFEIPTGNGFCMYVKRNVINEIGFFDEIFGMGYGEENDLCMRALELGYKNFMICNLFVYHRGNSTFGKAKEKLSLHNRKIIDTRYPSYKEKVRAFIGNKDIQEVRSKIGSSLKDSVQISSSTRKNILYVLHEGGGGVPNTTNDLLIHVSNDFNCYILTSDTRFIYIKFYSNSQFNILEKIRLDRPWSPMEFYREDLNRYYLEIILRCNIDIVHIRHLFKHSLDIVAVCRSLHIPYILSIHDFYMVSPSIHLLNRYGKYEEGVNPIPWLVPSPLLRDLPMTREFLQLWMKNMREVIVNAAVSITSSASARSIFESYYPELFKLGINFLIIEHGRDDLNLPVNEVLEISEVEPFRILILGNITEHKGSKQILELVTKLATYEIEFHLAGTAELELLEGVRYHGKYEREDLTQIIKVVRPHVGLVLSITPETYCHTLTEYWANGIPVIGSKLGAVGNRIEINGGGWLVDPYDLDGITSLIINIVRDPLDLEIKKEQVRTIKCVTGNEMAYRYISCYNEILTGIVKKKIGIFTPGKTGSAHVRCLLPYTSSHVNEYLEVHDLTSLTPEDSFEYCRVNNIKDVIIQRNALDKNGLQYLQSCKFYDEIGFEIDDDLFSLSSDHPDATVYSKLKEDLEYLLRNSDLVIISTEALRKEITERVPDKSVHVIRNYLDEKLWFTPIGNDKIRRETDEIRVGYFGTSSHIHDLEMIKDAFLIARKNLDKDKIKLVLEVVGVTRKSQDWYRILPVPSGYSEYPDFVSWIRQSVQWDIGIAPLVENKFNKSKSYQKYLEYTALGVPGIYSRYGEYQDIIENGTTGILVDNKVETWSDALIILAKDSKLRTDLLNMAQKDVYARYLLSQRPHLFFRD